MKHIDDISNVDDDRESMPSVWKITFGYFICAMLWILLSDHVIENLFAGTPLVSPFQTIKGFLFVLLTSVFLFVLLSRFVSRLRVQENELRRRLNQYQNSERKYKTLVENSTDLIWSFDADGHITYMNEASVEVLGRKPTEVIGLLYTDLLLPEQIEHNEQALDIALQNNDRIRNFINTTLHRNGQKRILSTSAVVLRDHNEDIIGSTGVSRDITESNQLRQQVQLQANLLSAVQQAIIATDLEGNIIYWNDFATQLYGWTEDEVMGRPVTEITVPQISRTQAKDIMANIQQHSHWSGEFVVTRKDGTTFPALVTNSVFYDDEGNQAGIIGLSIDISKQKQRELQLRAVNAHLQAIVNATPAAIVIIDDHHRVKDWNPAAERIFGWDRDTVIDEVLPIIPDDRWDEFVENVESLKDVGGMSDIQVRRLCKDGDLIDVSLSTAKYTDVNDNMRYIAVYIDISERAAVVRQLEQTFASLTEVVLIIDTNDRSIVKSNDAIEDVLGYRPEEVVGMNTAFLHVSDEAYHRFGSIGDSILEQQGTFRTEYQLRHKDGTIIDTEHTVTLLDHEVGHSAGAVSVIRDITEQKRSRLQLERSEARYRQLFNNAPIMIWQQDFSGMKHFLDQIKASLPTDTTLEDYLKTQPETIMTCLAKVTTSDANQAAIEGYGAQSKEDLLTQLSQVIHVSYEQSYDSQLQSLLAIARGQTSFEGEFINQTIHGEHIDLLVRWVVLPGYEETYEQILLTSVDITRLRQIQDEIKSSLDRERKLLSQSNILRNIAEQLVDSTQFDHIIISVIRQLRGIVEFQELVVFEVKKDELVPLPYTRILYPHIDDSGIKYTDDTLLHQSLKQSQAQYVMNSDNIRQELKLSDDVQGCITIPLVAHDITMGLLCVTKNNGHFSEEDVNLLMSFSYQIVAAFDNSRIHQDLEKSYEQLQSAQEKTIQAVRLATIGELAAGVAHQINNPLMTIIADSHLLLKHTDAETSLYESAQAISRAAHKAGDIVQRLLDFARTSPTRFEDVHLNESLRASINLVRAQIEPRYATIKTEFADDIIISGSESHLQDVWMNILLNARDAVRDTVDGEILIQTEINKHKNTVHVIIEDKGTGIDLDHIDNIFDPFFTTKAKGTGLGLSICTDIVHRHDGEIKVHSEAGLGTRFIISLPIKGWVS